VRWREGRKGGGGVVKKEKLDFFSKAKFILV